MVGSKPTPEEMKAMPLVYYIAWMMDNGHYDINPDTGEVTNVQTGQSLKHTMDNNGYPYVTLAYSNEVERPVRIHRMIAVKVWGADRVLGKEVAHLDHIRHHSVLSNLQLMDRPDHIRFDGTHAKPKKEWEPCAKCGTSDGRIGHRRKTPNRISGVRFGYQGKLCANCYTALYKRERRKAKPDNPCHGGVYRELLGEIESP